MRDDLAAELRRVWARLRSAGTWLDGRERLAIAAEARAARGGPLRERARSSLSPAAVDWRTEGRELLFPPMLEAVRRIAADPSRLSPEWIGQTLEEGVRDVEYVEMVGVVITVVAIDTFRRGLGAEPLPLPEPEAGEPTRARPEGARPGDDHAVPTVPREAATGTLAELYERWSRNPHRPVGVPRAALSLVPEEAVSWHDLGDTMYVGVPAFFDPLAVSPGRALDRMQVELIAARTAGLNDCFYCGAHSVMLRKGIELAGSQVDVAGVLTGESAGGVREGDTLLRLTEAAITGEDVADALCAALGRLSPQATVDAVAVAAYFDGHTRMADSTGCRLPPSYAPYTDAIASSAELSRRLVDRTGGDSASAPE